MSVGQIYPQVITSRAVIPPRRGCSGVGDECPDTAADGRLTHWLRPRHSNGHCFLFLAPAAPARRASSSKDWKCEEEMWWGCPREATPRPSTLPRLTTAGVVRKTASAGSRWTASTTDQAFPWPSEVSLDHKALFTASELN